MHKKADAPMMWKVIIGLVLGAFMIYLAITIYPQIFGLLLPPKEIDQGVLKSLHSVADGVDGLLRNEKKFDHTTAHSSIKEGYILVGFDKDYRPMEIDQCFEKVIEKPKLCFGKACLCLFMEEFEDVITCRLFEENIKFSSWYKDVSKIKRTRREGDVYERQSTGAKRLEGKIQPDYITYDYSFLSIDGGVPNCAPYLAEKLKKEVEWGDGINILYVDKFIEGDTTYVYVAEKTNRTDERAKSIQEAIGGEILGELYQEAIKLEGARRYDEAIAKYEEFLAKCNELYKPCREETVTTVTGVIKKIREKSIQEKEPSE